MDVQVVDPEALAQAIRSAGRPLHINTLVRTAARAWLEARQPRPYAPGNSYRVGETLRIADQTVTIEAIQRGENPKQGSFAILTLRFPDGIRRFMAAEIPGAPVAKERPPIPEERIDELLVRVEGLETTLRQAVRDALQADPRFVSLQTPQGEIWCLQEMLPPVDALALQKVLTVIQQVPIGEVEPLSYSTEELVHIAWALTNDGSATYDLHAFALFRTLMERGEVTNLGDRWTSSAAWTAFTARTVLSSPRVPTRLTPPVQTEAVSRWGAGRSGQRWREKEPEAEEQEKDLETWRRGRRAHAVFTLRARHYYEGWLPLDRQVRHLFAPLASGRQEVVFYHHFGDQPESFRAWVDWKNRRIWVSQEMYETFRRYRIYPGARLRISARNEREYDIATRPTDRTDPIRVWRMWLDEEGHIQYEEHWEPRLYDVDDEVYIADVRYEDLQALFRQAEEVGNSIFGLMYEKACQWWEEGGRQPLIVTADRLFQAIHFDEKGRMVSKATIAWELWQRKAFEPLGGGRYRFRPEFGTQKESPAPVRPSRSRPARAVRSQPVVPPVSEWPQEVAGIPSEMARIVEWPREPEEVRPVTVAAPATEPAGEEAPLEAEPVLHAELEVVAAPAAEPVEEPGEAPLEAKLVLYAEPEVVAAPAAEPVEEPGEAHPEAAVAPVGVLLPEAEEARLEAEFVLSAEQEVEAAPPAEPVVGPEAEEPRIETELVPPLEVEAAPIGELLTEASEAQPETGATLVALLPQEIAPTLPEVTLLAVEELPLETAEARRAAIPPEAPVAPVWEMEEPPLPSTIGAAPSCPGRAAPLAGKPARRHRIRRVYTTFRSIIIKLVHGLLRRKARVSGSPKENPEPPEEL